MNRKKITTTSKQTQLIAMAIIAASAAAAMIIGINNGQNLQKAIAQEVYPPGNSAAAKDEANEYKNAAALVNSSGTTASATVKAVSPNQSTNKEFWINTVHLD